MLIPFFTEKILPFLKGVSKNPSAVLILGGFITYFAGEKIKNGYLREKAKGEFSLNFVRGAYNRFFWSSVFISRVRRKDKQEKIDDAWDKLTLSLEKWNTELMGNTRLFEKYYPRKELEKEIENCITTVFWDLHDIIIEIRYNGIESRKVILLKEAELKLTKVKKVLKIFCKKLDMDYGK